MINRTTVRAARDDDQQFQLRVAHVQTQAVTPETIVPLSLQRPLCVLRQELEGESECAETDGISDAGDEPEQ